MRLIGEDNKLVRVKSIESRPTEEVYTIAGVDSDAYSVTGNHRLTLRWNSHPTAAIFSDEDGQTMAGYAYYDAWTQKAVRVMWNCEPMDSAEAPEHSATPVVAAVPTAATAGDEIPAPSTASTPYQSFTYPTRLTACAAARAMFLKYTREGVWERPSSLPDFQEDQDLEKRRFELEFRWGPMCNKGRIGEKVAFGETSSLSFTYLHSTSHPSEVLTGTHEEILSQVRAEFDQLDQASYLQRGQLFEMSASELHSRQEEFLLGTKHALVSGRRVMVPRREKHEEGVPTEQGQGWSSTKVMDGNGSYREVLSSSTRASVVYQLFNPSTASPSTGERPLTFQSNTFEQLDKVHRALDIDLAAENALLMELNPSAQTPSSEHASLCTRRILESISTGAETIVAFGEHTHAQWRAAVADGALSHLASSSAERRFGDSELRGLQLTLPTGGRSTLVLFAPHPSLVAQSPLLYTALAITHGLDVAQAVRICTTVAPHERIEFLSIDRKTVATSTVWNIEIDAATPAARRYALGDGTLTHNCWSFGVTIYELLHGVRPWKDWTRLQAAGQAVQQAGAEAGANGAGAAGGAGGVSPDPRKDGGGGMGGAGALQEEKTSDKADSQKDTAVKNMRQIHISSKLDPVTADFLTRILAVDKKKRLGCGPGGWEDVKAHPWLKDVDWDKIARKEVQPPITPDLTRANVSREDARKVIHTVCSCIVAHIRRCFFTLPLVHCGCRSRRSAARSQAARDSSRSAAALSRLEISHRARTAEERQLERFDHPE
jgi:hypothetical protein